MRTRWSIYGRHNNVEKISWLPSTGTSLEDAASALASREQEQTTPSFAYVYRKGATPIYDPYTKTPLSVLPLPGSRGTPTLILHRKFTEENNWGAHNALSLAHGAGRAMSRSKALSNVWGQVQQEHGYSTYTDCGTPDLMPKRMCLLL